jgi:hypothetical protein
VKAAAAASKPAEEKKTAPAATVARSTKTAPTARARATKKAVDPRANGKPSDQDATVAEQSAAADLTHEV